MSDSRNWTNDSDDLLAKLAGSWQGARTKSIVVARYPDHHSVLRLVADGYLSWDEPPRPLRRLRVTPAGLIHARAAAHAYPAGRD
ncbi:MAG TPA: hypothetical protein PKA95_01950 [Thermomicrobiales bacterium]|nr:hypothetical protein [Thermomicrobiales bacterium]